MLSKQRALLVTAVLLCGAGAAGVLASAEQGATKRVARFTATTTNVASPGQTVTIDIYGWSNDRDRNTLVDAWNVPVPIPAPAAPAPQGNPAAAGRGGRGGRGAAPAAGGAAPAGNGRGGAAAAAAAAADDGGGRGPQVFVPPPPPKTPGQSISEALAKAPTMGLLWTSEVAGYSIRYAYRLPQPDGSERIILATDRRLSPWSPLWKPAVESKTSTDYKFSIIELRVNAQGLGEGKASLQTPVSIDEGTKSIALDNYDSLPVVFSKVKALKD